jgi:hypothetical protein
MNRQLKKLLFLNSKASIGAIYKTPPKNLKLYKCKDGTYSDTGSCNWHGGLKDKTPKKYNIVSQDKGLTPKKVAKVLETGVTLLPIGIIKENRVWFQNRKSAYSERSVNNIINAYENGRFLWANFDAITVYPSPDGKLYVLSGHSRLEAFKRLCKIKAVVDGRDFCEIPAKIAEGLTLEQAKKVALESNTLSTKETIIERSNFYRRLIEEGKTKRELEKEAKRLEGANAKQVLAFAYLNKDGKTYNAITLLDTADQTSRANMQNIGRWIGNARKNNSELTNRHEDEIFDWLVTQKMYGTKKGQISNEREFQARLGALINKRTFFGKLDDSLNIKEQIIKSPIEKQYEENVLNQENLVKDLNKKLNDKIRDLTDRGATAARIQQLTEGIQATLTRERINLRNLKSKKSEIQQAAGNELSLFSISGFLQMM